MESCGIDCGLRRLRNSDSKLLTISATSNFYATHLGFAIDLTAGRARSMVGVVVAMISVVIGGPALARSRNGNGRTAAIVSLVLGLIGTSLGGGIAMARSRRPRGTD